MIMADYYEILGVGREASREEIRKVFRRLARETHPDANPGDTHAEERFREIAQADEVLSEPTTARQGRPRAPMSVSGCR